MTKVELELPDETFSLLQVAPENFANEMRFAAATHWYH